MRVLARERLKEDVHRLRIEADGAPRSVVAKRLDPAVAARSALVARRWLPAAGLGHLCPRLLEVRPEPSGSSTLHVYEDVPGRPLSLGASDGDVRIAIDALARLHTSFARHPLLPEARTGGGDRGIHFYAANLGDALDALDRAPVQRRIIDPLRARLQELREDAPQRTAALAAAGPDTLLHGDLWPSNVLIDGEDVRLVDWDEVGVGPYGYDLSTLLLRFPPARRAAILDAYSRAVGRLAGWRLPPAPQLGLILETAAQARLASLVVWSIAAASEGEGGWLPERLASVVEWLDDVSPVVP
jgi:Ser/Thr protein kinase RdoA (MazF antagonist)